jgi:hypothetical protein
MLLQLLKEISEIGIQLKQVEFSAAQISTKWLGNEPATSEDIALLERRLGLPLPDDYINFLKTTNGFSQFSVVDSGFNQSNEVDYLRNRLPETFKSWVSSDFTEFETTLGSAIIIGGIENDEQQFLLIPPTNTYEKWRFLESANWALGETEYTSIRHYLEETLELVTND